MWYNTFMHIFFLFMLFINHMFKNVQAYDACICYTYNHICARSLTATQTPTHIYAYVYVYIYMYKYLNI